MPSPVASPHCLAAAREYARYVVCERVRGLEEDVVSVEEGAVFLAEDIYRARQLGTTMGQGKKGSLT
jgi:hypothetical protein